MRFCSLVFLIALASDCAFAQAAPYVVVSAGKGWRVNGTLAQRGKALADSDKVSATGESAGQLIIDCKRAWVVYSCRDNCQGPPCLNKTNAAPKDILSEDLGPFAQFTEKFLRREPRETAVLGVRAGGNPTDAVLQLEPKGVHWGPALGRVLEGRYCFRLTPLPTGAARNFAMEWDRSVEPEGIAAVPNLTPGVYSMQKGTPQSGGACELDPESTPAWVAIAAAQKFLAINAEWKLRSSDISQVERSSAGPAAAALLRHAVLASFDESAAK
jgi:hypothetical protein